MEIHTSLDEIIDTLKKLRDAVPADFHHQDSVKQDIVTVTIKTNLRQDEAVVKDQVVTLTAAIETNFLQGDLEAKVDGTKGDVTETETESNEALSEWEEGRILTSDENGAVVCMRKRKSDDVCTSVRSVEVNEIQTCVGESSFWLRARLF